MAVGHFMMTFEPLFYPALLTIILGSGLFVPSLPSQIVELYAPDDPRRLGSYNVYYVGVNTGGFLAPLVCGALGEIYGWHYGFGAAGIGMVIGLVIYLWGGRWLPAGADTGAPVLEAGDTGFEGRSPWRFLVLVGLAVVVFRSAYEQLGNTIAVWAGTGIDRQLGSFTIPMTWFQSLNSLFVISLTPLVLLYWRRRAVRAGELSAPVRMATGAWMVALSYAGLAAVAWSHPDGGASWLWLVAGIAGITIGELWVLPVGLGLFGRLAPARLAATTIAAWYFAGFVGNLLSGVLGTLLTDFGAPRFFLLMGGVATLAGAALLLLDRPARAFDAPAVPAGAAAAGTPGGR
jgi:POT family proton-dependent oligopeptide transporter